jgi:hypothetical protein
MASRPILDNPYSNRPSASVLARSYRRDHSFCRARAWGRRHGFGTVLAASSPILENPEGPSASRCRVKKKKSSALEGESVRATQAEHTGSELCVTWSVTWTGGCAPGPARRPGDPRTGVSLPATPYTTTCVLQSGHNRYRRPPNGLCIARARAGDGRFAALLPTLGYEAQSVGRQAGAGRPVA